GGRGRSAPHRARPRAARPVDGSGPPVCRHRGGALWRRHAGAAGRAHARAAGRGATGLRRLEERVLRVAGHAALPELHGAAAHPLFVVTAPANDDLLAMLRREILPEVRRLVGERRVTLCFDREGWSPKFFRECHPHGFDILTYRRGPYPAWRRAAFRPITATV